MEIKHTVEILTKDIQEIEKLVGNLDNYEIPPQIELDLALSKLRNVYELLMMIKSDAGEEARLSPHKTEPPVENRAGQPEPDRAGAVQSTDHQNSEPQAGRPRTAEPYAADPAAETESSSAPAKEQKGTGTPGEPTAPEKPVETSRQEEQQGKQQKSTPGKKEGEILAEQFNKSSSINDEISGKREAPRVEKNISSQPIESISRNIGINDRFYIIRELFDGKSEGFNDLIRELDRAPGFEEAHKILEDHFGKEIEHEGARILVNLSRRKFISGSHG